MSIKTIQQAFKEAESVNSAHLQPGQFDDEIKKWRKKQDKTDITDWNELFCIRLVVYYRQPSRRKKYSWNAVWLAKDLLNRFNLKFDTQEEFIYYKIKNIKLSCHTIFVYDNRPGAPAIIMHHWTFGKWIILDYKRTGINQE